MEFHPLQKDAGHRCEKILDPLVQPKGGWESACHGVKNKMSASREQGRAASEKNG
jgi:hypothetical protein